MDLPLTNWNASSKGKHMVWRGTVEIFSFCSFLVLGNMWELPAQSSFLAAQAVLESQNIRTKIKDRSQMTR